METMDRGFGKAIGCDIRSVNISREINWCIPGGTADRDTVKYQ